MLHQLRLWRGATFRVPVVIGVLFVCVGVVVLVTLFPSADGRFQETQRQINYFMADLQKWMLVHQQMPDPILDRTLRRLQEDKQLAGALSPDRYPLVLEKRDAWAQALIYEVSSGQQRAVLRSVGPDGKDDEGGGDDIQAEAVLPFSER